MSDDEHGNPVGTMAVASIGVITALLRELVKSESINAERFLHELDLLSSSPGQELQTPLESRMEKKVFDLMRLAIKASSQEEK